MSRILICEDEEPIRSFVAVYLRHAGFDILEAADGETALALCSENADIAVVLLDVMLPGISGFDVCAALRRQNEQIGIIMLTARTQENERVQGLRLGADDYVSKPFSPAELTARVEALCRRVDSRGAAVLHSGNFTLDLRRRLLTDGVMSAELTQVELQLMEFFFQNAGKPLSRADILEGAWGGYSGDEKVVDVNVRRLRMKLESDASEPRYLQTVRGIGYCWTV